MKIKNNLSNVIQQFIGLNSNATGHLEKWVSASGGLAGIFIVLLVSQQFLSVQDSALIVASMGATAVLLFAVPHGPLSQPWAVIGGHLISAIVGVACARWIPDLLISSAVAVSLAILCMHYLRCIHPPGGATALTAVVGGETIHALGFQYVLTPVLLNAFVIVFVAVVFNYAFIWRRYPAMLAVKTKPSSTPEEEVLSESDLKAALQTMNSTIDISSQDLAQIYQLARQSKLTSCLKPEELKLGHYYSNGLYGTEWQVRQIVDMAEPMKSADNILIYKIVAGAGRRQSASNSFADFAKWSKYEVLLNENSWQRKEPVN